MTTFDPFTSSSTSKFALAAKAPLKIIACIDDPAVIQKILTHLAAKATAADPSRRPLARAPPEIGRKMKEVMK